MVLILLLFVVTVPGKLVIELSFLLQQNRSRRTKETKK